MTAAATDTACGRPSETACIILARGGSKGVPGKNLRPVGGVSLIGRAVRAGRAAAGVTAVYVSTDDSAIATEAALHGARIIERPAELAGDTASSEAGWLHAVPIVRQDLPGLDKLVFLQCTSPFTTGADIDGCLAQMAQRGTDCALSVTEDHSFLWGLDDAGRGVGINHDARQQRQRRQDLPPQYCESGAIYCVQLAPFLATGQRFCGSVALYPVDHPPIEIDSLQDFALCAQIATAGGRCELAPARLREVKAIVMDFDGVHTDNLVLTDQNGIESVRTSRGDGMGISALRDSGCYQMMILSKERNPVVLKRAEKLQLEVHHSIDDKVAALTGWLDARGLSWADLLYVGNDINDRAAMERAGLSACPADSHPTILAIADWILPLPGGRGALRAMADTLLSTVAEPQ
ncbi:acylneuraminate cytidylyltransferase [Tritonibacter mobilis]|uniref:acylneuraminate cytidylyltransferase n=1 Tax=Tritonibacter mobilis TaxID=379347 RepID=UPI001C0811F6|nr:acylneuraminate cytidylyltransferase [Tritonibacter mobilis]MBU3036028.1 acylneuraminate cytidylyltransferase [Tritonibacter mobilis]WHQ85320.1 acylneuraminate cytidylyltransferase [Tritonibacter mobilis]